MVIFLLVQFWFTHFYRSFRTITNFARTANAHDQAALFNHKKKDTQKKEKERKIKNNLQHISRDEIISFGSL